MTDHYFEHPLAKVHYYKFGTGPEKMLCFHGYGMHGKQFKILEQALGNRYTFYGFDLFFHKETILHDQSLETIRKGLSKTDLCDLVESFCSYEQIGKFSLIAYSMGTHYATTLLELIPERINEYIALAPSFLSPGTLLKFLSLNRTGNKIFEKLTLSKNGLLRLLRIVKGVGIVDDRGYQVMYQEIATPVLRFNLYATATYMKHLLTEEDRLVQVLNEKDVKSYFIFGKRDHTYPIRIGSRILPRLKRSTVLEVDEGHELVNRNLGQTLLNLLQ